MLAAHCIEKADISLVQLEIPVETVAYISSVAASLGKKILMNPAPASPLPARLAPAPTAGRLNSPELRATRPVACRGLNFSTPPTPSRLAE